MTDLAESCAACGLKFSKPRPKPQCRDTEACARRQAAGKGEAPAAPKKGSKPTPKPASSSGGDDPGPATDEARAGLKTRIEERAAARKAAAPAEKAKAPSSGDVVEMVEGDSGVFEVSGQAEPPETTPTELKPFKVQLTSRAQEVAVGNLFPGAEATGLRSGPAGHWLVVHPEEVNAVFTRVAEAAGVGEAKAGSVEAALRVIRGKLAQLIPGMVA